MRFAAIADIHGNALALEAVLADIAQQSIETVVNLGDHLSGPLEPARVADRLVVRDFPSVAGNHDRQLIDRPSAAMGRWERLAVSEMTPTHRAWIRSLPATRVFRDEVFLCHGTPDSDTTYWLEVASQGFMQLAPYGHIARHAHGIDASLMLCGHSHVARSVQLLDGRMIVNPGSVGCQAYDDPSPPAPHVMETGSPDARYAICDKSSGKWIITFRQVPYDHQRAAEMARAQGEPKWVNALATGWLQGPGC
jgi:predicted phosphodiesterase